MSTIPTVGYWDMRGLGEPIRYLLKYKGIKFDDKRYHFNSGTTPQEIGKYWSPEKYNLGLDFPNLPYYIDGDVKVGYILSHNYYLFNVHSLIYLFIQINVSQTNK